MAHTGQGEYHATVVPTYDVLVFVFGFVVSSRKWATMPSTANALIRRKKNYRTEWKMLGCDGKDGAPSAERSV